LLLGGTGNDTLFAGMGQATMAGGVGADTFDFLKGTASTVTILDFSAAQDDTIKLQGFASNEAQFAIDHAKVTAAGTTVTLSDHTKITFADLTNLNKSDFS
jgi:Ca2+-binding RTX toxin-like protein